MQDVQRRLSAIVCADVAGYSRLVSADEEGTLARLKTLRHELIDPKIAEHHGRLVKTAGDGILLEFASAVDAVRCAMEVQQANAQRNSAVPANQRIEFRIGINVGDIVIDGEDILGDGVNVAARLEALAEPGAIWVSRVVRDATRDKLPIIFEDCGHQHVKNIARPLHVFRLVPVDRETNRQTALAEIGLPLALPDKPSIAVLPFANMSGDVEQEYFADGISEDIITALAKFPSLFVIARNSSFTYKAKNTDVRAIGRDLGVRYVLEGSVRKGGGQIRITGQLIQAETGGHVWADKFDGSLDSIFDLQDQITEQIVGIIEPMIKHAEVERVRLKRPESLDCYDHYLKGLSYVDRFTRESSDSMLHSAMNAIRLDPRFAPAYALAVRAHIQKFIQGWMNDVRAEGRAALDLIERGLEADRSDAFVLATAGHGIAWFAHDLERAIALLDEAVALNPNYAHAFSMSGMVRIRAGQTGLAIEHLNRAQRLSPRDSRLYVTLEALALAHLLDKNIDTAYAVASRATQLNSNYLPSWRTLAAAAALAGRQQEAQRSVTRLLSIEATHRIELFRQRYPIATEKFEVLFEGLRLAGLPE